MRVRRRAGAVPVRVRGLMTAGSITSSPYDRLTDAAARMRANGVGALAVMEEGRLTGIITERDLLRAMADGLSPRITLTSAYMTADPCTIGPDEDASQAARTMIERGIRHLPVVEEGRVIGVISARDLLQLEQRLPVELLGGEPW